MDYFWRVALASDISSICYQSGYLNGEKMLVYEFMRDETIKQPQIGKIEYTACG